MGNSFACFSHRSVMRSKARRPESRESCHDFEHSDQLSLKALESLKAKSLLKSHKARSRGSSHSNHLSIKEVITDSLVEEKEKAEREGIIRVKMVLTKEEVTQLLSMLSRSHGGMAEQYVERIGWAPSLQTIREEENR